MLLPAGPTGCPVPEIIIGGRGAPQKQIPPLILKRQMNMK